MRIISKWKDFYDSALGYGYDPKLVYVREERILWDDNKHHKDAWLRSKDGVMFKSQFPSYLNIFHAQHKPPTFADSRTGAIAFCGRLYPFYKLPCGEYCYNFDQVYKAVSENAYYGDPLRSLNDRKYYLNALNGDKSKAKRGRWAYSHHAYGVPLTRESWKHFQDEFKDYIGDDLHIRTKSPIITHQNTITGSIYTANDRLNKYNFARRIDPFTAYQELSMYIGNNLVEQKDPNPYISDELKRDTHGFDKFSFKKPPQKKK